MQKVKLVWDFFGPESKNTAQHHLIHLSEFSKDKSVNFYDSGTDSESENNFFSFIVIDFSNLDLIKKMLKPNRAFKA
jgi:hypothetical protein